MLDVLGSIKNLTWNTEHHFLHLKNQHEFMRIWAVQFELGYTDFRTIQLALQLDQQTELLKQFTKAYDAVYPYEYAFVKGGLEGFNQAYGDQMDQYDQAHQTLLAVLQKITEFQPKEAPENNLI